MKIHPKYKEGAFYLWHWQDKDIERPRNLKKQLIEIIWRGFSGVVVSITDSRYEFTNLLIVAIALSIMSSPVPTSK